MSLDASLQDSIDAAVANTIAWITLWKVPAGAPPVRGNRGVRKLVERWVGVSPTRGLSHQPAGWATHSGVPTQTVQESTDRHDLLANPRVASWATDKAAGTGSSASPQ